jgi:Amt family ammonium transporter
VVWLVLGYSLAFSGTAPFIGDLSRVGLMGLTRGDVIGTAPEIVFFAFQMAFAIITPALMIGAVVERVKFAGLLAFCAGWLVLVYAPVCHWIWGGGWMAALGVKDYAGGLVVHATAGVSALILAKAVGPRDGWPRDLSPPHNPGMTMTGAGLLWVGWFGFNGGSALAASADAGAALTATHMAAASAGLVWALIEHRRFGRASLVGLVTGVVAGLATVTPASGFISPLAGLFLGALGSYVCFEAVSLVKARLKVDDSLDVFAVHGVGGILGTLMLAGLAHPLLGGTGYAEGVGLAGQAWRQALSVVVVCAWSAGASLVLVAIVRKLTGLRASEEVIDEGLDLGAHGERAYHIN